jgi:hypothetical protein
VSVAIRSTAISRTSWGSIVRAGTAIASSASSRSRNARCRSSDERFCACAVSTSTSASGRPRQDRPVAGGAHDRQVAEVLEQVAAEATRVVAVVVERPERAHRRGRVAVEDGVGDGHHQLAVGAADHLAEDALVDLGRAGGEHLLEQRLRVAQAAVGLAREERQRGGRDRLLLGLRRSLEVRDELVERDAPQVVALAARHHRRQHLLRIRGGEDELHVPRRLFERLQERVERVLREHVHFVDDVDLEPALHRPVRDRLHQVAHLVDLRVRRAVDLEDVERDAVRDLLAGRALVAGIGRGPLFAVERLREDARRRGLADAARTAEEERSARRGRRRSRRGASS